MPRFTQQSILHADTVEHLAEAASPATAAAAAFGDGTVHKTVYQMKTKRETL